MYRSVTAVFPAVKEPLADVLGEEAFVEFVRSLIKLVQHQGRGSVVRLASDWQRVPILAALSTP